MSSISDYKKALYFAIRDSIRYIPQKGENPKAKEWYYKPEYKDYIERIMKEEFPSAKANGHIDAMVSSARFCFLDFYNKRDRNFEVSLKTGLSGTPKLDASVGKKCYECKCREILDSHDMEIELSKSYARLQLFQELLGRSFKKCEKENEKNDRFFFSVNDLGIKLDYSGDRKLHFDVKQMVCHLIGIANSEYYDTLQYVIYCPSKTKIDEYGINTLYEELEYDIDKIWDSPNINAFTTNEKHKITLPKPMFVDVSEINDFVYEKVY